MIHYTAQIGPWEGSMQLLTARQYRMMAEEARTLADIARDGWTRQGFMNAAENYERIATSLELIARSQKFRAAKP